MRLEIGQICSRFPTWLVTIAQVRQAASQTTRQTHTRARPTAVSRITVPARQAARIVMYNGCAPVTTRPSRRYKMVLDSFRSTVTRSLLHLACVLTWILGASTAALAQTSTADTLQRIKARGYINLGHRESSVPFSFVDDKGQVVGYSHELALRVVDAIRQYL